MDQTEAHLSQTSRLETRELRGFLARRRWLACGGLVRGAIRISRSQGGRASQGNRQGNRIALSYPLILQLRLSFH